MQLLVNHPWFTAMSSISALKLPVFCLHLQEFQAVDDPAASVGYFTIMRERSLGVDLF